MARDQRKEKGKLDDWFKMAKEDELIEDNPTSKPQIKETPKRWDATSQKQNVEKDGWIITPRGLRFPTVLPKIFNDKKGGKSYASRGKEFLFYNRFAQEYPEVRKWLDALKSDGTRREYARGLLDFCIETDVAPKEFGELWHTIEQQNNAKVTATRYIQGYLNNPSKAARSIKALKSFFRFYSGGFILPLDTQGVLAVDRTTVEKPQYAWGTHDDIREKMAEIIPLCSRDLRDQFGLTLLYRSSVRDNVLNHIKVKHVQDIIEVDGEELLCLTVTGYNPETDEGLCEKTKHYKFPRLKDAEGQPRGYYTFIARDALVLFKTFMDKYHRNSKPDDKLFVFKGESNNFRDKLHMHFNNRLKTSRFPKKLIVLHQFRANFNDLAMEALKENRAKMLSGHKLKGVEEHYQKRNKIQCAKDYLKIKFLPTPESLKAIEARLEALEKGKKPADEEKAKEQKRPSETEVTETKHWGKEAKDFMEKKRERESMDDLLNRACFLGYEAYGNKRQIYCVRCKNAWDTNRTIETEDGEELPSPYAECKRLQNQELAKMRGN